MARLPVNIERWVTAGEDRYRDHDLSHEWEHIAVQGQQRIAPRPPLRGKAPSRMRVVRIDRKRRRITSNN